MHAQRRVRPQQLVQPQCVTCHPSISVTPHRLLRADMLTLPLLVDLLRGQALVHRSVVYTTWRVSPCAAAPQCFPGGSVVQLEGGVTKTMAELAVGDRVLVAHNTYSDVRALPWMM